MSQTKKFFGDFARIIVRSFAGRNIYVHIFAAFFTAFCVWSGFDWFYFVHIQALNFQFFLPALILGSLLPIVLPAYLLVSAKYSSFGLKHEQRELHNAMGRALALAVIAGSAVSSLYKIFTGRVQPNRYDLALDITHRFQFGFWKHGIFWGWPSSHTTIAFAMVFALIPFLQKNRWAGPVIFVAIAYAVYVGIGMSTGAHWISDVISGMVIGSVIGISTTQCVS